MLQIKIILKNIEKVKNILNSQIKFYSIKISARLFSKPLSKTELSILKKCLTSNISLLCA